MVIMVFAALLAFGQINGRPFITFLVSWASFVVAPKRRLWGKDNAMEKATVKLAHPTQVSQPATKTINKSRLEQLATILDTGGKMETAELSTTHEINLTVQPSAPKIKDQDLGVEDVLSDTES